MHRSWAAELSTASTSEYSQASPAPKYHRANAPVRVRRASTAAFALTKGWGHATLIRSMESQAVSALYGLVSGPVFLSASFSWFIAQLLKTIIDIARQRLRTSSDLVSTMFWKTGGMPSSHSALVTALATSIGFRHGFATPLFSLSLFYGVLIIRDALGVRRSAGVQAQALNALSKELHDRLGTQFRPVKEISGHTPAEVTVGAGLGFFIALAFSVL